MLLQSFLEVIKQMNLDAYINQIADEHFEELIGPSDQRVRELTGYTDKAKAELKNYELVEEGTDAMRNWITANGIRRIGICSKLILSKEYKKLFDNLKAVNVELVPFDEDLFDQVWKGKPKKVFNNIFNLESFKLKQYIDPNYIKLFKELKVSDKLKYNLDTIIPGETYKSKLRRLQSKIKNNEGYIISNLETIGWITNLRGNDHKYSSDFYSFAYLTKNNLTLFTGKLVELPGVKSLNYADFYDFIKTIKEEKVFISGDVNFYIYNLLNKAEYSDMIEKAETITNQIETFGFKMGGIHDAKAIIQLFTWLENSDVDRTEKEIKNKLISLKSQNPGYYSESFDPIIASGINSSKIYHETSDKKHTKDELLLVDVGSHYMYATTDITRTVCFGSPTPDMIRFYTITLKSLVKAKYIKKSFIKGNELDEAIRYYLKQIGKDFITSSGHGVGHFSYVHEAFPKLSYENDVLALYNVFTLEPFYRDTRLGIRLEDQVMLNQYSGLVLQTSLSFVPYQLNLIDNNMLTEQERKLINLYSRKMREFLSPLFSKGSKEYLYLMKNTEELPYVEQTKDVFGDIYNVNTKS